MAEANYPSNSNRSKAPETRKREEIKPIVSQPVTKRKAPLGKRVREQFAGEDAQGVGSYILLEVAVPALKNLIADAATQSVERLLFGDSRPRAANTGRNHISYGNFSRTTGPMVSTASAGRGSPRQHRAPHRFDEIVVGNRAEAEEILDRMVDLIGQYDNATVADFNSLLGITGEFTDANWGWTSLSTAAVRRAQGHDGWYFDLPNPVPIQ